MFVKKLYLNSSKVYNTEKLFSKIKGKKSRNKIIRRDSLQATLWELLGLRWPGIIQAIIMPLCLTMVLFLGPLYMMGLNGLWRVYIGEINTQFSSSIINSVVKTSKLICRSYQKHLGNLKRKKKLVKKYIMNFSFNICLQNHNTGQSVVKNGFGGEIVLQRHFLKNGRLEHACCLCFYNVQHPRPPFSYVRSSLEWRIFITSLKILGAEWTSKLHY